MSPQKKILEKLRTAQALIDQAFEEIRQLEFASSEPSPADDPRTPNVKPMVAFRKTDPAEYENEFNGMIGRIRRRFSMPDGSPIHIDWFDFVRDLQNAGKTPDEARQQIAPRVKSELIQRPEFTAKNSGAAPDRGQPHGTPATPPPPPPKKISQNQLFNARR